jgi:SEC-C motif-containing protein
MARRSSLKCRAIRQALRLLVVLMMAVLIVVSHPLVWRQSKLLTFLAHSEKLEIALDTKSPCPCGSRQSYGRCCESYHQGAAAPTPEALMRSRYSAFVLNLPDYLQLTWHPSTRPKTLQLENSPQWTSLQVLASGHKGATGTVHFRALYKAGSGWGYLEEASDFVKEAGRWYYVAGTTTEGVLKPGRNDKCPCGSGCKYKACCLKR